MQQRREPSKDAVAVAAAQHIAAAARAAIAERGVFHLALSGGSTPWVMLERFAALPVAWQHVHVWQVDERVAPDGDAQRNWTTQHRLLHTVVAGDQLHPMPVADRSPEQAATDYAVELARLVGDPPVLDLVQLGIGDDGHTASLVPGDPVLERTDRDVAATAPYRGHRRVTLTLPAVARAREIVWLITGADKAAMVARLLRGDRGIPAGRVPPAHATLFADDAAAGG